MSSEHPSTDGGERRGPIGRRDARKRAVEFLYEASLRDADPVKLVGERVGSTELEPISDYTVSLVEGIARHRERIDELLSEHAHGWTLDRMPAVDLAVLRTGTYEILWAADVPDAVAIDEAVGIARRMSTDDSPRFVNGVLGRIGAIADRLRAVL